MDSGSPEMWRPGPPTATGSRMVSTVKPVMWRPQTPASTSGKVTGTVAPVMWRPGLPGPTTTPTTASPEVRVTISAEDAELGVVVGTSTGGALLAILALVTFYLLSEYLVVG